MIELVFFLDGELLKQKIDTVIQDDVMKKIITLKRFTWEKTNEGRYQETYIMTNLHVTNLV